MVSTGSFFWLVEAELFDCSVGLWPMRWGKKAAVAMTTALGCLALSMPMAASAAPINDDFANRETLGSDLPVEVARSNLGATKETDEFLGTFLAAGHSVWFEWQAPASEWVTIGACNADFPSIVGVFTGTAVNALTPAVSGNANEGPHCPFAQREYTFRATSGMTYQIAVDGNAMYLPPAPPPVAQGTFTLRLEATPPPSNDDFENAASLNGRLDEEPDGTRFYFANLEGHNRGATKEAGEPNHNGDPGGASVWYAWTPPESGIASINACCGGPTLLGVYAGGAIGGLTPLASGLRFTEVSVVAGTTYRIAVDGELDSGTGEAEMGGFSIRASMRLSRGPGFRIDPIAMPGPEDRTRPKTTISKTKVRPGRRTATFTFVSSERASFKCRLDGRSISACISPKTYKGLKVGRHTFEVVAMDSAGNSDISPATAHVRIPKTERPSQRRRSVDERDVQHRLVRQAG